MIIIKAITEACVFFISLVLLHTNNTHYFIFYITEAQVQGPADLSGPWACAIQQLQKSK